MGTFSIKAGFIERFWCIGSYHGSFSIKALQDVG